MKMYQPAPPYASASTSSHPQGAPRLPAPYFVWSHSTVHSMPYLSRNIAKIDPHGLSLIGISTVPPAESPAKIFSASARFSVRTAILERFSCSFTGPMNAGTSFAINRVLPMGSVMRMIFCASFSGTGNSALAMSRKRMIFPNSPPKTDW